MMWETALEYVSSLRSDAEEWTEGRSAPLRLPLLAYLLYAGIRHLLDPMYRSWFAGITLVFHEVGHIVFALFGRTIAILGGSIMQVLVPTAAAIYLLLRQRDFFGFAVGGAWFSYSLWEMATYMADANQEALPLVGFSDHPEHDWGTLLTQWHLLNWCDTFATVVRVLAFLAWGSSMLLGGWLCWRMWRNRQTDPIG